MRSPHIRIIGLLLLTIIFYVKNWTLLPYWSAMIVSLEILNRNKGYLNQPFYRFYNGIFMGYLILVVWDRTRTYHVGDGVEWAFNSLMHILFGLVVCFKISQYVAVFNFKIKNRVLYIALIFNILGVLNEFMQNMMCHRETFVLISDSQKDLVMNMLGTLIFIAVEFLFSRKSKATFGQ
jgi:VanZ family protein